MVPASKTIFVGLPNWVIESLGLPGSPFCADECSGEEFPRGLTEADVFHAKFREASSLAKRFGGRRYLGDVDTVASRIIAQKGAAVASRFFKSGVNDLQSLLEFARFLFLNNDNVACFLIVDTLVRSLKRTEIAVT